MKPAVLLTSVMLAEQSPGQHGSPDQLLERNDSSFCTISSTMDAFVSKLIFNLLELKVLHGLVAYSHARRRICVRIPTHGDWLRIGLWVQLYFEEISALHTKEDRSLSLNSYCTNLGTEFRPRTEIVRLRTCECTIIEYCPSLYFTGTAWDFIWNVKFEAKPFTSIIVSLLVT